MEKRLLFQAYGTEGIIAECKYALLQLATVYKGLEVSLPEVVVYTDRPQDFILFKTALSLHIIEVDAAQIAFWKGKINFVHRVKIEIIKDCLHRFSGTILYLDTDTFCLKKLESLFKSISSQQVVMYEREGLLKEPNNLHFKKWKRFLQRDVSAKIGEKATMDTEMWNAGVIGLQESHGALLEKVLDITDHLYPLFPKHTVEQFAFCYTFQSEKLQIISAQTYFFHYWNLKEFRTVLLAFFKKHALQSFQNLLVASADLQPEAIVKSKLQFENRPSLVRAFKKLTGKKWTIDAFMPKD